jgi:glycosyltransferase involved in cell wall biosynthesis
MGNAILDATVVIPVSSQSADFQHVLSLVKLAETNDLKVVLVIDHGETVYSEIDPILDASINSSMTNIINVNYGSPGKARNAGVLSISTKWTIFWDADDYPIVEKLLELRLDETYEKTDVIVSNFMILESNGVEASTNYKRKLWETNKELDFLMNPSVWRAIYRTKVLQENPFLEYKMAEDQCLNAQLIANGARFAYYDEVLYKYVINRKNQLTSDKFAMRHLALAMKSLVGIKQRNNPHLYAIKIRVLLTSLKRLPAKMKIKVFIFTSVHFLISAVGYPKAFMSGLGMNVNYFITTYRNKKSNAQN